MVRFDKSKLLVFNLFLLLQGCVRLSFGNNKSHVPDKVLDPIGNEIHQALSILESSGISTEFLCHNGDEQLNSLLPQCLDEATYTRFLSEEHEEESHVKKTKWYYIKNVIMVIFCVTCAAMAAGLTMGLLSLEVLDLKIKEMAAKSDKDRESAKKILPLMEDYHRLLVTLLLLNSFSNEALPIFLDALVPSYMAVIISVTLVLFFGEIIPTAIFAGPNKLAVASSFAWFVKFLLFIFAPLAIPIARMLDRFLHDHENEEGSATKYNRGELAALVKIQYEERMAIRAEKRRVRVSLTKSDRSTVSSRSNPYKKGSDMRDSIIHDEVTMVQGALTMRTQTAKDVMTPLSSVYALCEDMLLDTNNMVDIYRHGHSRIPIYSMGATDDGYGGITAIKGVLLTRSLIVVDTQHCRQISQLPLQTPHCVSPNTTMAELVNLFQKGQGKSAGGHLALVCINPTIAESSLAENSPLSKDAGFIGLITLEDCVEELIQEEIYDEFDSKAKRRDILAKKTFDKWRSFARKKKFQRRLEEGSSISETTPLVPDGTIV